MPRPTSEQLRKINKLAHTPLKEEQVYVFRSLSADTKPVRRVGWFGEFSMLMTSSMLQKLKKDYKKGVGLLASHNKNRLPFGRSFDAEVVVDHVNGEEVETLYIDHYIVTHTIDEDGNKVPLMTEIGMTTQDIANHIDVGHTFDTSIGFTISMVKCSICGHDLRDGDKCKHMPGIKYDVQVGDKTEKVRCDIIVADGEGLENSLVYAGAVDRAIITKADLSYEGSLQEDVNDQGINLYTVDDIKTIPLHAPIICRMSKGDMRLFTTTSERNNIEYLKGSEEMSEAKLTTEELKVSDMVSLEEYNKVISEKEGYAKQVTDLEKEVEALTDKVNNLTEELEKAESEIEELSVKAKLADEFTEDLIQEVLSAGVKARGNAFNKDRYEKYARTLSVDELKEELEAFKQEFSSPINEARVTSLEVDDERKEEAQTNLTVQEKRQIAARNAMMRYQREGGDLEALTMQEFEKLMKESD